MTDEIKKIIFLYSGEGTRGNSTDLRLFQHASLWPQIESILKSRLDLTPDQIWDSNDNPLGCPESPLATLIAQVCLADLWISWGYHPQFVIGHSTGELAAAYQAGFYDLETVLELAYNIGKTAAGLEGAMAHGWLSDEKMKTFSLNISSCNFSGEQGTHVTISGEKDDILGFVDKNDDFTLMKIPHPWHHELYKPYADKLAGIPSKEGKHPVFISGITTEIETCLTDDYWAKWLCSPVNFIQSMKALNSAASSEKLQFIEIGFHPVLADVCRTFKDASIVSSMFRDEDAVKWILYQRSRLNQDVILAAIKKAADDIKPGLDFDTSLAYQGVTSMEMTKLSGRLQPLFPTLAPQDFFRFKTINKLIAGFGIKKEILPAASKHREKNDVVIAGMSCRFPASIETPVQFWQMLTGSRDQIQARPDRGTVEAGFLNESITQFDHSYFNIPKAEAQTMDPQQILALELTEMLLKDAGIDPDKLDKKRVGVYIGVWNQEFEGDRKSVFYPTGVNPSIISARISYHYDFRGPSMVINTACSSSLQALHYAAKDIEDGRIDYAVAGGVNMLLDDSFSRTMQASGFLSSDFRCKAFDDSANGYVRAEGGGLVFLAARALAPKFYATLEGSAVNQNGGRAQVITAPHPEAQEEVILDACSDAQILPNQIAYLETHGTGTKIGDPIEISAIQNTIAQERSTPCLIGSVKSNLGHLESAAGMAGLIKSVIALQHGTIPANLHFNQPNQFIDFESGRITVVNKETPIDRQCYIGISSFGFGGSNAHIVIKGANDADRKKIEEIVSPFNREKSLPLSSFLRISAQDTGKNTEAEPEHPETDVSDIPGFITSLIFELTGMEALEPDIELLEQGLDSLSATELLSQLMETFNIEIEAEILFEYPLPDLFIQRVCELVELSENDA